MVSYHKMSNQLNKMAKKESQQHIYQVRKKFLKHWSNDGLRLPMPLMSSENQQKLF
ncbi:hypothetical protein P3TCK_27377 [Photobacterium profundum 3TCK]|uniref:Uncharacterized protein n=1 Tax=Photobacterium profundum 3TCK TaxID=314280 RepID=Q1Z7U6_9GAMM|nr:hypothetical protein P3TCK_27377 [Photobacterium profundum 3TCK]